MMDEWLRGHAIDIRVAIIVVDHIDRSRHGGNSIASRTAKGTSKEKSAHYRNYDWQTFPHRKLFLRVQ
jgi:hypothetical protein